jgi:hypothetical protein
MTESQSRRLTEAIFIARHSQGEAATRIMRKCVEELLAEESLTGPRTRDLERQNAELKERLVQSIKEQIK